MFARDKDILALQEEIEELEERFNADFNEAAETCNKNFLEFKKSVAGLLAAVEIIKISLEDNNVDTNELQEKLDILCQHLGVSIEYQGEHRAYDVIENNHGG